MSDYVLPPENGKRDHLALFVITEGEGVRKHLEAANAIGYDFKPPGLQALVIERAEGCAEWLRRRIREDRGFPDPPEMTMHHPFTSRYRGKRYNFGHPACPDLEDQTCDWKLLRTEEIGVRLTEGMKRDPEATVSALVFHHSDCMYFGVGEGSQA